MSSGEGRGGDPGPPSPARPAGPAAHTGPPRSTCARRRAAPTCRASAPGCLGLSARARRQRGRGSEPRRPGWGCAARLPRDAPALGAGNEEEAGGGSGGGAAGTRSRLSPGGRGEPVRARKLVVPGREKSSRPASFLHAPSRPPPALRLPPPARSAPLAAPRSPRRPAAGTRAGARAGSGTPGSRTLAALGLQKPRSNQREPGTLGQTRTLMRAPLKRAQPGEGRLGAGRRGRASTQGTQAGAEGRRTPGPLGLTRQPGSRARDWAEPKPRLPAHWAGWAPGRGGSGLEGWASAPHPQTPAAS